jgi:hypothetical protein
MLLKIYKEGYETEELLMMLGVLLTDHDVMKSIYFFKKTIGVNPESIEGHYGLGMSYYYSG